MSDSDLSTGLSNPIDISPTSISSIIKQSQCQRFTKMEIDDTLTENLFEGGGYERKASSTLLYTEGEEFEESIYNLCQEYSFTEIHEFPDINSDETDIDLDTLVDQAADRLQSAVETVSSDPTQNAQLFFQFPVKSHIGPFRVTGFSDIIAVYTTDSGETEIRVFDVKASWNEKTSQQIQIATYTHILRNNQRYSVPETVSISGGVIHKENYTVFDAIEFPTSADLPRFDVRSREDDIGRLLSRQSQLYKSAKSTVTQNTTDMSIFEQNKENVKSLSYQLDSKCKQCKFRDFCLSSGVESLDIGLLKINQGVRDAFKNKEIHTLTDLFEITTTPSNFKLEDVQIKDQYEALAGELRREFGVENIVELSVQAGQLLNQLAGYNSNVGLNKPLLWKTDAYPETMPEYISSDDSSPNPYQGLKIFINPQYDYISNSIIQLNARLQLPNLPDVEKTISFTNITENIEDIPLKPPSDETHRRGRVHTEKVRQYEEDLFERFLTKLYDSIKQIGDSNQISKKMIPHFYLYNESEHQLLVEATERHSSSPIVTSFRNLLGVRNMPDKEQQLWGYIEDDLKECYLVDQLATFVPSITNFIGRVSASENVNPFNYSFEEETYNLQDMFDKKFFDYKQRIQFTGTDTPTVEKDTFGSPTNDQTEFGMELYTGSQIPIEYFWGSKEIENINSTEDDSPFTTSFMYTSRSSKEQTRMSKTHLSALGSWIVDSMAAIEDYMIKNRYIKKEEIDVTNIEQFDLHSDTLHDSVIDYEYIEFNSTKSEARSQLRKPAESRIKDGKAIPFEVTNLSKTSDDVGVTEIEGELLYSHLEFEDSEFVKQSTKFDEGDYTFISPLERLNGGFQTTDGNGNKRIGEDILKHGKDTQILTLDLDTGYIKIRTQYPYNFLQAESTDLANTQPVFIGQTAILDEQVTDRFMKQTVKSLEESRNTNTLYNRIDSLLHGSNSLSKSDLYEMTNLLKVLSEINAIDDSKLVSPNKKQEQFVLDLQEMSLLQGPPGTGKTTGSVANAIACRMNEPTAIDGLITGPSNKAIDEVLNSTAEVISKINQHSSISLDVDIFRLESHAHNTDIEYQEEIDIIQSTREERELVERVSSNNITPRNTLIFATPSKIEGLFSNHESEWDTPANWFDLFVADEGSMLTLSDFLRAGTHIKSDAQVIVTGDHRQMSPVQSHTWDEETRPNIQSYVPYLSSLNYLQYLQDIDNVTEFIGFPEHVHDSPNASVSIHKLERTYRCHKTIAQFLQKWVYAKDGIEYTSDITNTISPVTDSSVPTGVQSVLDTHPLVIITHDDTSSQESSIVESNIIKQITDAWDESDTGVVSPHSSQKGLLRSRNVSKEVDTVERFQGGERDLILISSTVSDPTYIKKEDDFLLNPNRINVAISRMKEKVILIVPNSVFEHIPTDIDTYEKSKIWNGLYTELIKHNTPSWNGTLGDFAADRSISRSDVNVQVYRK